MASYDSGALSRFIPKLSSDYRQQKDDNPAAVNGTCEWFLHHPRFLQWRQDPQSLLLHVLANPGCGKSVLARKLVDGRIVCGSRRSRLLYFFFKRGQGDQDRGSTALGAMVHQIYVSHSADTTVGSHLKSKYEAHGDRLRTMQNELWDVVSAVSEEDTLGETVCVLDALDECAEQDRYRLMEIIALYYASSATRKGVLKLLITSRPYTDLEFEPYHNSSTSFIRLDGDADNESGWIAGEINIAIRKKIPLIIPKVPSSVQEAIIRHLQSMDNKTYLWLDLIYHYIKHNTAGQGTEQKLKRLISEIPPSLDAAYEEMLNRSPNKKLTKRLLSLTIAAHWSLGVEEMATAMAILDAEPESISDVDVEPESISGVDVESDEQFKDTVKNLCGLLLAVHDGKIHFLHQTAREFLLRKPGTAPSTDSAWKGCIDIAEAESVSAEACIRFLLSKELAYFAPPPHKYNAQCMISPGWCFTRYAELSWYSHYHTSHEYLPEGLHERLLMVFKDAGRESPWHLAEPPHSRPYLVLQNATSNVFREKIGKEIYSLIGRHGLDVDAISTASQGSAVGLWLRLGEDWPAVQPLSESSSLKIAILANDRALLRLLLAYGAAEKKDFRPPRVPVTPLWLAARCGHADLVRLLLDERADVNFHAEPYGGAVHAAQTCGSDEIFRMLLAAGAVEKQGEYLDAAKEPIVLEDLKNLEAESYWLNNDRESSG